MQYQPFEPFKLPRKVGNSGQKILDFDRSSIKRFWMSVDQKYPGLSSAKGCYIFAIRAGKGIRPWYVGQTRRAFAKECFQSHKRSLYREADQNNKRGTPLLLLLARSTAGGNISRGTANLRELDFVEQMLIGLALGQNKKLLNKKATKFMRDLQLPGLLNTKPGVKSNAVTTLRSVLGQ